MRARTESREQGCSGAAGAFGCVKVLIMAIALPCHGAAYWWSINPSLASDWLSPWLHDYEAGCTRRLLAPCSAVTRFLSYLRRVNSRNHTDKLLPSIYFHLQITPGVLLFCFLLLIWIPSFSHLHASFHYHWPNGQELAFCFVSIQMLLFSLITLCLNTTEAFILLTYSTVQYQCLEQILHKSSTWAEATLKSVEIGGKVAGFGNASEQHKTGGVPRSFPLSLPLSSCHPLTVLQKIKA